MLPFKKQMSVYIKLHNKNTWFTQESKNIKQNWREHCPKCVSTIHVQWSSEYEVMDV